MVPIYHAGDVGKYVFVGDSSKTRSNGGTKKRVADDKRSEQFGSIQTPPQSPIELSCREIRRLCWELGSGVRLGISDVLEWSSWDRWHQGQAKYHHYRRREPGEERVDEGVTRIEMRGDEKTAWKRLEAWEVEVVWRRREPTVAAERLGKPYAHARRAVLDATVHARETN